MMQSISHWGQFEMQAAGTENFREVWVQNPLFVNAQWNGTFDFSEVISPLSYDARYLHESNRTA